MKTDWFTSWFNTPYYHILYKNRNDDDAQVFMKNITQYLKLPLTSHIADLPCGKGRHSIFLNTLGYKVTGADLSTNSIKFAKKFENKTLDFQVLDMRNPLEKKYDAIFNLFTSFGYFKEDSEDIKVLNSFKNGLKKEGVLVLDFLNVEKLKSTLVSNEIKIIDNITFTIKREIKDGFILKHISFTDKGKQHNYTEEVKYLDLIKFKNFFLKVGLEIKHIFGNYKLEKFNPQTSDRLIFVLK